MTEPEYIAYFENLARQHGLLQHNPDDPDHQAFYVVHDDNMAELEQAVRSKLSLPALLLDQYYDELDTTQDNNRLRIEGGISILVRFEKGDTASMRAARHQARQIARQFLNRLRRDLRPGGVLSNRHVYMNPVNAGEPVPMLGGNATGWGYGLSFWVPTSTDVAGDDWLDIP